MKTLEQKIEAKKNAIKNHCKRVHASYEDVMNAFNDYFNEYKASSTKMIMNKYGKLCCFRYVVPETIVNTYVTNYDSEHAFPYDYKRCLQESLQALWQMCEQFGKI